MVRQLDSFAESGIDYESTISSGPKASEKYSLRQRQRSWNFVPKQDNSNGMYKETSSQKLTALRNRNQADTVKNKSKIKTAPLSKYRRKTANARERSRMREINLAFDNLRQCVPSTLFDEEVACTNEKFTKITTLRLAMKYIHKLTQALSDKNVCVDYLIDSQKLGTINEDTNKRTDFRMTKFNKLDCNQQNKKSNKMFLCTLHRVSNKNFKSIYSAKKKSRYETIDSALTESDGESAQLSESCFSPFTELHEDTNIYSISSQNSVFNSIASESDNDFHSPFDVSLCLLNSTQDKLDFSINQDPTFCVSPFLPIDHFEPDINIISNNLAENCVDLFSI